MENIEELSPKGAKIVAALTQVRDSLKDQGANEMSTHKSFKVACYGKSESSPSFNGLRFATEAEAKKYGSDLYSRWMGMDRFEVVGSEDEPNRCDQGAKEVF